jgi:signal transduction histidine kinase
LDVLVVPEQVAFLLLLLLLLALAIYASRRYVGRTRAQMAQSEEIIAKLQRVQQETQRRAAHLEALNAVIVVASTAPDLPGLLEVVLDHILQTMQLDMGAIWAADQLVVKGILPEVGTEITKSVLVAGLDPHVAFIAEDWQVAANDVPSAVALSMVKAGIRASITVPILGERETLGGLCVGAPGPRFWSAEEVVLIGAAGRQLGAEVERLRLLSEAQQHAQGLEVAVAQLQELDRLKNEFMQNASHELRTPLALIRGYMELMRDGEFGEMPPDQRDAFEVIIRQTQMLGALVEDITLSLAAKARSFTQEPVPMDDLVLAGADDFRVATERAGLSLVTEIEPDLPRVSGEPYYLRRVLDNLVGNAIKFTPKGGTITLRLQRRNGQVLLQVCDTGIGIPPAEQKSIFARFYQVDGGARRKYGGMGLGLALVKEIVEAHGGTVDIESNVNKGSIFAVSLPIL